MLRPDYYRDKSLRAYKKDLDATPGAPCGGRRFQVMVEKAPPSLVDKGGHALHFLGGWRGLDPSRQLRRTKRAFFSPLAI
jgi:hypothetical protein